MDHSTMMKRHFRKGMAYLLVLIIAFGMPLHLVQAAAVAVKTSDEGELAAAMEPQRIKVPEYVNQSLSSFYQPFTIIAYRQYKQYSDRKKKAAQSKAKVKAVAAAKAIKKSPKLKLSERELNLLARIIYAESRGEPFLGQVAVGAVVLNRLSKTGFPKTIEGVIEQPRAFTAVDDGQYALQPDSTAYEAAVKAIEGEDPTNGALYYFNPQIATSDWIWSRKQTVKIGRHIFAI